MYVCNIYTYIVFVYYLKELIFKMEHDSKPPTLICGKPVKEGVRKAKKVKQRTGKLFSMIILSIFIKYGFIYLLVYYCCF